MCRLFCAVWITTPIFCTKWSKTSLRRKKAPPASSSVRALRWRWKILPLGTAEVSAQVLFIRTTTQTLIRRRQMTICWPWPCFFTQGRTGHGGSLARTNVHFSWWGHQKVPTSMPRGSKGLVTQDGPNNTGALGGCLPRGASWIMKGSVAESRGLCVDSDLSSFRISQPLPN